MRNRFILNNNPRMICILFAPHPAPPRNVRLFGRAMPAAYALFGRAMALRHTPFLSGYACGIRPFYRAMPAAYALLDGLWLAPYALWLRLLRKTACGGRAQCAFAAGPPAAGPGASVARRQRDALFVGIMSECRASHATAATANSPKIKRFANCAPSVPRPRKAAALYRIAPRSYKEPLLSRPLRGFGRRLSVFLMQGNSYEAIDNCARCPRQPENRHD